MNKKNAKVYAALALLAGVIGLSLIQVSRTAQTTQTELALFNVIQLIFSFGFSWILSSHYSELSFLDSQKKFAIGAFRRIKEIERSISRAQQLLAQDARTIEGKAKGDHQPIMMSLLSAQDAVNSSIADWGGHNWGRNPYN